MLVATMFVFDSVLFLFHDHDLYRFICIVAPQQKHKHEQWNQSAEKNEQKCVLKKRCSWLTVSTEQSRSSISIPDKHNDSNERRQEETRVNSSWNDTENRVEKTVGNCLLQIHENPY